MTGKTDISAGAAPEHSQQTKALTRADVRTLARDAGFSEAGLVALPYAAESRDARRFREWVSKGRAGSMHYLQRKTEEGEFARERVTASFPWARSAIVCFASYLYPEAPLSTEASERGSAWLARYAWTSRVLPSRVDEKGERRPSDYHKILLRRLKSLDEKLHAQFGEFESRAYVDTGPVVERALAVAAGVGWTGKNTCLINPELGSWGFLAVLLTSLQVSEGAEILGAREQGSESAEIQGTREQGNKGTRKQFDVALENYEIRGTENPAPEGPSAIAQGEAERNPGNDHAKDMQPRRGDANDLAPSSPSPDARSFEIPDRCGTCTRCIEACPTNALDTPYQMDATRCIAYLTIEHKGPIGEELMPQMGRQVFGCDICQDVCPWNRKAMRGNAESFSPTLSAKGAERMGHPPTAVDPELEPRPELINPALEWLASLDERSFEKEFNGSPVRRTGWNGLRRNIAIAMGNSGLAQFAPQLETWAAAADEGLRSAARWALKKLRPE